jgi:hypothetical protein
VGYPTTLVYEHLGRRTNRDAAWSCVLLMGLAFLRFCD